MSNRSVKPEALRLTANERAVCALIVAGMSNRTIALKLDIGLRTVELYRHCAAAKLDLGTTPLIVWVAINRDWLPDPKSVGPIGRSAYGERSRQRQSAPTPEEITERAAALRSGKAGKHG